VNPKVICDMNCHTDIVRFINYHSFT